MIDAAGHGSAIASKREGGIAHLAVDIAVLCAVKLAIGAYVIRQGFSHISDDDYARSVIAERFAYAPGLDPSGTSWLPLPFWITGAAMVAAGRSLATARGVALALGAASIAAPYAAMRAVGARRVVAIAATSIAMALPWNAWLGAATVPEAWTAALVAAGAIAMGSDATAARVARPCAAAALLAASLSRYEAWPVCAVAGARCAWRAIGGPRSRREVASAVLASAGPLLWMAWNAHAHGSAFHFLARVSAFRHAIGAAELSLEDKLLGYPRSVLVETPEAAALGLVGVVGLYLDVALRRRWAWAMTAVVAMLVFLIAGDLHDGAPTHHAARALAPAWWVLVGLGVDATIAIAARPASMRALQRSMACVAVALVTCWVATLPSRWRNAPGQTEPERRDAQIARGLDMRARGVARADVTPCSFEHFALIAAWGRPEGARIAEGLPREPPTANCPVVVER